MRFRSVDRDSLRATVDILNLWGVAILVVTATSTAGVVGAAVFTGEFDVEEPDEDELTPDSEVVVNTQETTAGITTVTWTEPGDARALDIRDQQGESIESLGFVGDSVDVEADRFQVWAVYGDGTEEMIYQHA